MASKRIAGLDFLRIISMLGIVGIHVINAGGALSGNASLLNTGVNSLLLVICYPWVNIFAMLSGYLYAGRENIKSANLLKLIASTLFYCAAIASLFLAFGIIPKASPIDIATGFFPFIDGRYWYLVCYIFLFLMIPFLNRLTSALDKKAMRSLVVILFVLLSVYTTVSPVEYFYVADGYSPVWLVFCYLSGSYIRLWGEDFKALKPLVCIIISLVSCCCAFGIWLVFKAPDYYHYNSPFTVITALMMVVGFSKINTENKFISKLSVWLSDGAFSVYIIHAHIFVMDYIITDFLMPYINKSVVVCTSVTLSLIVTIYIICWIAHLIKQLLFRVTRLDKGLDRMGEGLDKVLTVSRK